MDDEADVRALVKALLVSQGYEAITDGDGKTGFQTYLQETPDLAIIDLYMPVQEGLRTIVLIREKEPHARTIAISGGGRLGSTGLLSAADLFGVQHALAKPFSATALLGAVRDLLGDG